MSAQRDSASAPDHARVLRIVRDGATNMLRRLPLPSTPTPPNRWISGLVLLLTILTTVHPLRAQSPSVPTDGRLLPPTEASGATPDFTGGRTGLAVQDDDFAGSPPRGGCDPRNCGEFANCRVDGGGGDVSVSPTTVEVGEEITVTFTDTGEYEAAHWSWSDVSLRPQEETRCQGVGGGLPTLEQVGDCPDETPTCTFRVTSMGSTAEDPELGGRPWTILRVTFCVDFFNACLTSYDEGYFGVIPPPEPDPPEAAFTWQEQDNPPRTVAFDASGSSSPNGQIVAYEWDFGDGATGTGVQPEHTYGADDTYFVDLKVTDEEGEWARVTKQVEVDAARMRYRLAVDPDTAATGQEMQLHVLVENTGVVPLEQVRPAGEVLAESDDGAQVERRSGPTPSMLALAPGAVDTLTWVYEATAAGTVRFTLSAIEGVDSNGNVEEESGTCALGKAASDEESEACTEADVEANELVVNSVEDDPKDPEAEGCDTGQTVTIDGEEQTECTLRAAIEALNTGELDTDGAETLGIKFDIPGGGPHTIALAPDLGALPSIDRTVIIDGTTQPDRAAIQLDGRALETGSGLTLAVDGSIVRGLVVFGFPGDGVYITGSGNAIEAMLIGTDIERTQDLGNAENGIRIDFGDENVIGGETAEQGNVIAGNDGHGVYIGPDAAKTVVQGNRVGEESESGLILANAKDGIYVDGAELAQIGGETAEPGTSPGNRIMGRPMQFVGNEEVPRRGRDGIRIAGGATFARVEGNELKRNEAGIRITGAGTFFHFIGGEEENAGNRLLLNAIAVGIEDTGDPGESQYNNRVQGNRFEGNGGILVTHSARNLIGGPTGTPGEAPGNDMSPVGETGSVTLDDGGDFNDVQGNLLQSGGNTGQAAIEVYGQGNLIGGDPGSGNVISGYHGGQDPSDACQDPADALDGTGILLSGDENTVRGNYIGTDESGMSARGNGYGVAVIDGSNHLLQGNLISGNRCPGVQIQEGAGVTLQGNKIGTDRTGNGGISSGVGISLTSGTGSTVIIGGERDPDEKACTDPCNLISNNAIGVALTQGAGDGITIQGNFIGTTVDGMTPLPNGTGIKVGALPGGLFAAGVTIGGASNATAGTCDGPCNVIAANQEAGILGGEQFFSSRQIARFSVHDLVVQGNFIGVGVDGSSLGNGHNGILLGGESSGNLIGGNGPALGNVIAHNGFNGVLVAAGATSQSGTEVVFGSENTIRHNRIFGNGRLGIDLSLAPAVGGDGVTENDTIPGLDFDEGPNSLQNYPEPLKAFTYDGVDPGVILLSLGGILPHLDVGTYTIDFYGNTACGGEGHREGRQFIATATVSPADFLHHAPPHFEHTMPMSEVPLGTFAVSATATAPDGSTSEFSRCTEIKQAPEMTATASAGDQTLEVARTEPFTVGDEITINPGGETEETNTVTGFGSLRLETPLQFDHQPGETVIPLVASDTDETAALAAPTLTAPEDGTDEVLEHEMTLVWQAVPEAAHYDLQLARSFAAALIDTTGLTATTLTVDVERSTRYWWRVRGVTSDGAVGPWSTPWHFTTSATAVAVDDEVEMPERFTLEANYPNPFNPQTTIRYAVPRPERVRLVVYDVLGREVAVLVEGSQTAGQHEVVFEAADRPSGVYVYRLEAGNFAQTRPMLLVK